MPIIKDHIAVVKAEIDATGKRLETEILTADQLHEIAEKMAKLGQTHTWLTAVERLGAKAKGVLTSIGHGKSIIH
jgi:hypothetical protein